MKYKTSHILAGCAGFIAILFSIAANWYCAKLYLTKDGRCRRLRWFIAAEVDIPKGTKITERHLSNRFGKLCEGGEFVSTKNAALGKYAVRDLRTNAPLTPDSLSDHPLVEGAVEGAIVSLEVKADLADGLRPGVRLAFVRNNRMIPKAIGNGRGLLLVAVARSDAKKTILTVGVPPQFQGEIPTLATGEWHPVLVAGN